MRIDARGLDFLALNDAVRQSEDREIIIDNACGHRYIGAGLSGKDIQIYGVPGNAMASYLNGCTLRVYGNSQDATGDTMNEGCIYIYGSAGDTCGYAMRGGKIFIKGNVGYRTGIHMKEYMEHKPVIIVGGKAGSFLGEYQAGGIIVVLGIDVEPPYVSNFCGTGMHGGKIFIRSDELPKRLPPQVSAKDASQEDLAEISEDLEEFCNAFGYDKESLMKDHYFILTPNTNNPYHLLYTPN